jgi:hypothetical protein
LTQSEILGLTPHATRLNPCGVEELKKRAVADLGRVGDVFERKTTFFALFLHAAARRDVKGDGRQSYKSRVREN